MMLLKHLLSSIAYFTINNTEQLLFRGLCVNFREKMAQFFARNSSAGPSEEARRRREVEVLSLANCLSTPVVRRPIKSNLYEPQPMRDILTYRRCDDTSTEQTRIRTESWPRKGFLTSTEDSLFFPSQSINNTYETWLVAILVTSRTHLVCALCNHSFEILGQWVRWTYKKISWNDILNIG
jgi:hypothetical protein